LVKPLVTFDDLVVSYFHLTSTGYPTPILR